jgi:hypothetical protein
MTYSPRRANSRLGLSIQCEIRQGCDPWTKVRITDLSRTGFRMAWVPRSRNDTKLWIRIPGLQPLAATIRWQDQSGIGCEFAAPLYEPVFEHFARIATEGLQRSA